MTGPAGDKRGHVLLGFPRSGTTLLSRLLDSHPEVSCPPETYLMAASARFLHEQDRVEGPPIGVVAGLNFAGLSDEEVMAPLRDMVFGFHARIAGDKPIWVEKTAIDVFHLETLEPFLAGHVRFIVIERNPLDVIVSNLKLAEVMGAQLHDLFERTRETNSPHEGIARAWVERSEALQVFAGRHPDDVLRLRYEDLTVAPANTLAKVFSFLGVAADVEAVMADAFSRDPRVGLGDFNFDRTAEIIPARDKAWRGHIPPATLARIVPILRDQMVLRGYPVPKVPGLAARADAIRQFQMAAALKRERRRQDGEE